MSISPCVDPEPEHWYVIRKVKGYPYYKTITSVSSEAQVKNVFILAFLTISEFAKSVISWWILVHETVHFSVSHSENTWGHRFQLGVLGAAANITQ